MIEFTANGGKRYSLAPGPLRLVEAWDTDPTPETSRGRLMGERDWWMTIHHTDGSGSYSFRFQSQADRDTIRGQLLAHVFNRSPRP